MRKIEGRKEGRKAEGSNVCVSALWFEQSVPFLGRFFLFLLFFDIDCRFPSHRVPTLPQDALVKLVEENELRVHGVS